MSADCLRCGGSGYEDVPLSPGDRKRRCPRCNVLGLARAGFLNVDNDLRTDGGHKPPNMRVADRGWPDDAVDNKLRWGEQPPIDLTLALIEEVGELADEVLQSGRFESAEAKHARVCLAAARDAGFATRSFLESFFEDEDGEPLPTEHRPELGHGIDADAVLEELDDLAPLCYQLAWALDKPEELVTDGGVSISLEELEKRKHARSTTPAEERNRCPECGSTNIAQKTGKWGSGDLDPGRWYCKGAGCLAHFDRPVQEDRR